MVHKFVKDLSLSDAEINALSLLIDKGYHKGICKDIVDNGYFKTTQSARNCITKAMGLGIIFARERGYKVNPEVLVFSDYMLLDIRAHNIHEPKEQEVPSRRNVEADAV